MANYYVLTGQGSTKSWGYYTIPTCEISYIPLISGNLGFSNHAVKVDYLKSIRDNKYVESRDYFIAEGAVPCFLNLSALRGFCKLFNYKTTKPTLLHQKSPNLILQLVKAGALFQSVEAVFTKPIPQRIMDSLKKSKVNWSLEDKVGSFSILKIFV